MNNFFPRHIGVTPAAESEMLQKIGIESLDDLIDQTVPAAIRLKKDLNIPPALDEDEYLRHIKDISLKNKIFRSYIGQGYHNTIVPSVIQRNIFENPGWYTQYTPYQAEISQGRMEALLNFQTTVSDLTGLPIANASLLDEGTAAAEAMAMFFELKNKRIKSDPVNTIFVDQNVLPQTIAIIQGRALPIQVNVEIGDVDSIESVENYFAVLVQYPNKQGEVLDYSEVADKLHDQNSYLIVAADILSLTLLKAPASFGADAAVGNTQRFGVPMGYGGPHAGYFATKEDFKRIIPGRIIGMSVDIDEQPALRMALQTREQHIKREKATSNICTAQALLAIMAGMYAVYHGPDGLTAIAKEIHDKAVTLAKGLHAQGYEIVHNCFFDTLRIRTKRTELEKIQSICVQQKINFYYEEGAIQIALDESVIDQDINDILSLFNTFNPSENQDDKDFFIPKTLGRTTSFLTHEVFHKYRSETEMMRYIKHLENKDLSLLHSMIPLGSCTMKLNAATELRPLSWNHWSSMHPFVPRDQVAGYTQVFEELSQYLCEITGFTACSLQPNSGAQGELAGLLTIRAYHKDNDNAHRNIALIPSSAHGTNPASAVMAGMKVVVVQCDDDGNIDVDDLESKAKENADNLGALIVTYPSTHGVFEPGIMNICEVIHNNGGLVYMDGANMNAQVGLTSPGNINADVCHLNLHKTFAIPHGGGGPGVGPICVNDKLAPYLPSHPVIQTGGEKGVNAIAAAPWGSASILLISYAYIKMLGAKGLTDATRYAILNANYIKALLADHYQVLYTGENGHSAHELIIDLRPFKAVGVSAEDIAKRLIDYGFHAPTLSFPVAGTIMIEPTESESKDELDLFCAAMIQIKAEIDEIASGEYPEDDNVLVNAPHTIQMVTNDEWKFPYSRAKAAFPLNYLKYRHKFWAPVRRVNNAYGDRNLICTCPPIEAYME